MAARFGCALLAVVVASSLGVAGAPEPRSAPAHVGRWRDRVDWPAAGDEAVEVLSRYLRIDTTNPPGNEARGVEFLGVLLDEAGVPWERFEHAPGRESLVARLRAEHPEEGPLCLLSHLDVVPAEPERWDPGRGPLSGAIADGAVWGRGALDMKGMAVLELQTLILLRRLGVPLRRDLVLLAVADEEVHNVGMREVLADLWDRVDCTHIINEGGIGITNALLEGQTVHAISVAEKGTLWVKMVAEGRAGHGSTPYPNEAPDKLRDAMATIAKKYRPSYRIDPAIRKLLANAGHEAGGLTGLALRSRVLVDLVVKRRLKDVPATRAALTDTVHLTGMSGAENVNVVPSEVSATYDCRLRPGSDPEALLAELRHLTRRIGGIRFEVLQAWPASGSPWDDPLYRAIAAHAVDRPGRHVAGPVLSVGFTDSVFARPRGVRAYGYVPFVLDEEVLGTMHGHRERVPVDEVHAGLRVLFSIVVDVTAAP